jgi:hypothetical protein
MRVSNVRIEEPRPPCRAFRFRTPILATCDLCGGLFGLLTGCRRRVFCAPPPFCGSGPRRASSPSCCRPCGPMTAAAVMRCCLSKSPARASAARRFSRQHPVRFCGRSGVVSRIDQIGFRDQISERDQGTSVRWHTFTVRREWAIRKQSLFFPNADFRHYPRCVHRRAVLLFLEFWVQAAWAGITLSLLRGRTTRI